jgi:hypothetical protein
MSVRASPRKVESGSVGAGVILEHGNYVVKVGVGVLECNQGSCRNGDGIPGSTLMGLSPCPGVDLEDSPGREVRPIPHAWVQLFGCVETCLKGRDNRVEWRIVVRVAIKPSDGTREMYGRVDGFGICEVSEDPGHATRIVCVLFPKGFQVPYAHQ